MKLKHYLPLKAVLEDLGISRWTLWRAARSDIEGFPKPLRIGGQMYWKKSELEALEAALLRFEGRCAFDRKRAYEKRVRALTKKRSGPRTSSRTPRSIQQDLFAD